MPRVRVTGVAVPKLVFPLWLAVIEQDPTASNWITPDVLTEQSAGVPDEYVGMRPELEVARSMPAVTPNVAVRAVINTFANVPNVMLCAIAGTGVVAADVLVAAPLLLVAMTMSEMDCPASAEMSVYVASVAFKISVAPRFH
jgi:hypothetical protein